MRIIDFFWELAQRPWPWWVAGPLIGLTVPVLLLTGNKALGISSSLRHICAACIPGNISFFHYDWKKESWNLFFAAGIILGGWIAVRFLSGNEPVVLSPATVTTLRQQGLHDLSSGLLECRETSGKSGHQSRLGFLDVDEETGQVLQEVFDHGSTKRFVSRPPV